MINTAMLKAKLKENSLTQEEAARLLGIDPFIFNWKINNVIGSVISIKEANSLAEILHIPKEELSDIFFAKQLAQTQKKIK